MVPVRRHSRARATRHPGDTHDLHSAPGTKRRLVMPITQYLDDCEFDREARQAVSLAFEMAREALQLGDQGNLAEKTAQRIVELAKGGELDSDLLCESVVREFRQHL